MTDKLFTRHPNNPIFTAETLPYAANTAFNPGVARLDGETLLLVRVEDRSGRSHLAVATSADGAGGWQVDPSRALHPDPARPEELYGLEDPRVTPLEDGGFAILYTGYSAGGPLVCLATTGDFRTYTRHGVVLPPENKDAALFPRRIGGAYVALHRPVSGYGVDVWLAHSPDLVHWGRHERLFETRPVGFWDGAKIGVGPPPLETDAGWLVAYHGVRDTAGGSIYRVGLALLELEQPERVLARTDDWVFGPEEPYERVGDVGNVVFPCGWLLDGDVVRLYYGAADTSTALAEARLSELLALLT